MDPSTPAEMEYKDLRSTSVSNRRYQKQKQKYYGFRSGPMSRIGELFIDSDVPTAKYQSPWDQQAIFAMATRKPALRAWAGFAVRKWTKRDHWDNRTANIAPLSCSSHRKPRKDRRYCCCGYLPPRWAWERSSKGGRRRPLNWDPMDNLEFDSAYDFAMGYDEEDYDPSRSYDDHDNDDGDDGTDGAPRPDRSGGAPEPDETDGAPGTDGAHGPGGPGSGNYSGPCGGATKPPSGSGGATRNNRNALAVTKASRTTIDALEHAESEYDFVSEIDIEVVDMWNRHEWAGLDGWVVVGL